ncbi:50S ribosomal protein L18 [Candidatus Kuenenbacteria bacterium CG_4_9_14_3_um_filter_39_14]|uniref:Large ribosomal subunit protein uL18 n=6 Tax=Candidatus Kueneniibacteriota TaxID=1752740 RepID=A0A2M7MH20_9BACT|nr:50S ribosomal protein L18 [Candidatus Kuenenbacteria bacterium]OIP56759.1 MAG: 50S ribosomal protein L18 [Candidatus Kuenenbacteria bacterium CG2_30_39_24]PIP29068.1 MAG: 50S ribosomal protein L18 [Candidatus Kuenenbacteria bacterium CG23_combo_of_CG06-09_8_20_14_all_39_39]PIP75308.1 MAG: 50S ribosomal protein L18 [Candidatus Kuenenbacteria bacterium CG22_combo_CG10-13_8_21_14_all_39_9]PIR81094.1 MAG: 50S ribosomal protein L18 [Candidatus Kuenenbacteria bacterium CG10_big_fil_rev_8_21_14_0_1
MIKTIKIRRQAKKRRQLRTRAKIFGTAKVPRLNVSRSLKHIFLQLIDDQRGKTLASLHSQSLKAKGNKTAIAKLAGLAIAQKAKDKKISRCVFDKGAALYHGRVKAVAEGARQGGLKF